MKKTVTILAVLLAAQLLLAIGIGLSGQSITAGSEPVELIRFDADSIDRITLEGPDGEQVKLRKSAGEWVLAEPAEFPANNTKVKRLIERLEQLRAGIPVATSDSARERFKVSEEVFERRITLAQGNKTLARLYLGSSPGMRQIYARNDADSAIYNVKMAAYDAPVNPSTWEDKSVLTLPEEEIVGIEVNGLHIERNRDQNADDSDQAAWRAEGLEENRQLKPDAVDKLADLLAKLQFSKVLGTEVKEEYGLAEPVLELNLTRKGGKTLSYRVGKNPDKDEYTLKVSDREEYFRLASYKATSLLEAASPESLTSRDQEEEESEEQEATTPN